MTVDEQLMIPNEQVIFTSGFCRCKQRCSPEASAAVGVGDGRVSAYCVCAGLLADALEGGRAGVWGERAARALQAAVGRRVDPSVHQRGQAPQRWHWWVDGACVSYVVQIVVGGGARQQAWWYQRVASGHTPTICVGRRFPERHWKQEKQVSTKGHIEQEAAVRDKLSGAISIICKWRVQKPHRAFKEVNTRRTGITKHLIYNSLAKHTSSCPDR